MARAAMGDNERAWELTSLINPILHGATPEEISTYRVEPYVVAADVYGVDPHTGRGGWTWYTGSAGCVYRLIVESLLGLRVEVDKLRIKPCLPAAWKQFQIHYRYRETFYHISIHHSAPGARVRRLSLDGSVLFDDFVTLVDDRREHHVEVEI
jgi:cellobiose phosphorylase